MAAFIIKNENVETMDNCDNSFSSIDRLMEFGMGMAVAQQMVNTMNHCMQNMYVPGAGAPMVGNGHIQMPMPQIDKYYLVNKDDVVGPFDLTELSTLVKAKTLTPVTMVWKKGLAGWMKATDVPEVKQVLIVK